MLIYSQTIDVFLKKIKKIAREIINNETPFILRKTRIEYNNYYYPISFCVFEDPKKLGFFDPIKYSIGINKTFLFEPNLERLKNLIRHELSHYFCFLQYGDQIQPHGKEFRLFCQSLNWGKEVSNATENHSDIILQNNDKSKITKKIEKLLALSKSNNVYESQLAIKKANELLINHHLDESTLPDQKEYFLRKVYTSKRADSKLMAIYDILQTFYVQPVISRGKGETFIEVIGDKVSTDIADYVAKFLHYELDNLWNNEKSLKGITAKNSFFKGLSLGYSQKISQLEIENSKELIIHKNLKQIASKFYPRLGSKLSQSQINQKSLQKGMDTGKKLTIHKAVEKGTTKKLTTKLLGLF